MNCDEFITNLEDPDLQEGGDWCEDMLAHAEACRRCGEVLDIFQSIRGEVATLPRRTRLVDTDSSILLSVHEAIPQVSPPPVTSSPLYRAMLVATSALLAAMLVLLVPAPLAPAAAASAEETEAQAPESPSEDVVSELPAPLPPTES
jgi:hypothetical protein